MSYNFLDVLPDDIFSNVLSFNVDMLEQEIFKLEFSLLTFISATDDNIEIELTNNINDDNSPYIHICYNDITYSMDKFLLDIIEYEKICIVSTFSINGNETIYSIISSVMYNSTYYDILKSVNYLYNLKNDFLAINNAYREVDKDYCFLECLNIVSRRFLRKTKKLYNLPKIKDVVFLEAGLGS